MNKNNAPHSIDMLFLVIVFLLFTFSAITVVVLSAKSYSTILDRSEKNQSTRSADAYIRQVIKQNDDGSISITDFEGCESIKIQRDETVEYIYYYDGALRELYATKDAALSPAAGTKIMDLKNMTISGDDSLLKISFEDMEGECTEVEIMIKTGGIVYE